MSLKTVKQIIEEQKSVSDNTNQRSNTAGLLKAITLDAKNFFTNLFTGIAGEIKKNKFDVEVKNQIKLPEVQKIDGSVSLKDTKALLIGLNEIVRGIEKTNKTYEQSTKGLEKNLKPEKVDFSKLEKAIKDITFPEPLKEVSADIISLPKYISEKLDAIKKAVNSIEVNPKVEVKNEAPQVSIDLKGVKDSLQAILGAITAQEIKPEVNVDMKSVEKSVKKVEDAINGLRFPIPSFHIPDNLPVTISNDITSETPSYSKIIDTSGIYTYVAEAIPGSKATDAVWRVKRVYPSGTEIVIDWADGNANFDNVATDLTSLVYLSYDSNTYLSEADELLSWQPANPIPMINRTNYTFGNAFYDSRVGLWRAYLQGTGTGDNKIYMSTSTDCKLWTDPVLALGLGTSGSWDDYSIGVPFAWYEASETRPYRMIYRGCRSTTDFSEGLVTSLDGITWERKDTNGNTLTNYLINEGTDSIDLGSVIKVDGTYYHYYSLIGSPREIYLAWSTDLLTWTKSPSNPIYVNSVDADPPASNVSGYYNGRFCPDVVRWDKADGTIRYVMYVPHYEITTTYPSFECYTCSDVKFPRASRTYVGKLYDTSVATKPTIRNVATTSSGCDTPRIITDDITRNVTNGSIYSGNEIGMLIASSVTSFKTVLLTHHKTVAHRLDNDGTLYGASISNIMTEYPWDTPQIQLAPAGSDANTMFLFMPGITQTLLDWGPYKIHHNGNLSYKNPTITSNGIVCMSDNTNPYTNSTFAAHANSGTGLTDEVYNLVTAPTDYTIEAEISFASELISGYAGIVDLGYTSTEQFTFLIQRSGANYQLYLSVTSGGASHNVTGNWAVANVVNGQKYKIAVCVNSTTKKAYFFVNGTLLNTGGTAFDYPIDNLSSQTGIGLSIGATNATPHAWYGTIDNVRISNTCRWTASYTAAAPLITYQSSGTIFTPVYDFGAASSGKVFYLFDYDLPTGTTITIKGRNAASATDMSITAGDFSAYSSALTGQYQQFLLTLATTDTSATPVIREVKFKG